MHFSKKYPKKCSLYAPKHSFFVGFFFSLFRHVLFITIETLMGKSLKKKKTLVQYAAFKNKWNKKKEKTTVKVIKYYAKKERFILLFITL